MEDIMKVMEESLKYAIEKTIEERKSEFEELKSITGRDISELKQFVEKPWKIITYKDAIKKLQNLGVNIKYGD
uniref:amino acid--tRNA ligase-related protein n=1 Tax=Candidatus Nanopusillus massiliensis TaxID=2897163 RepID=UPI0027394E63